MNAQRLSDRKFGLMFTAVFLLIGGVAYFAFDKTLLWAFYVASAFAIVALLAPGLLMPLNRLWMWFSHHFSNWNNYLILGVFFYIVLLPFSLVMRLLGRDPMARKLGQNAPSYWTPVTRAADADTFNDMF